MGIVLSMRTVIENSAFLNDGEHFNRWSMHIFGINPWNKPYSFKARELGFCRTGLCENYVGFECKKCLDSSELPLPIIVKKGDSLVVRLAMAGVEKYAWRTDFSNDFESTDSVIAISQMGQYRVVGYGLGKTYSASSEVLDLRRMAVDDELKIENGELKLYPNPTSGNIYVKDAENKSFRVLDMVGREVKKGVVGMDGLLEIENLVKGVYLVEVEGRRGVVVRE